MGLRAGETVRLQDAHTGVEAEALKKEFDGWRNDPNHLDKVGWKKAQQLIETRYVRGGLRSFCNGRVQFGKLDRSLGYLRITAFYGYTADDNYESELRDLQAALDEIFRDAGKFNGLVIDVRFNQGGDDPLGIEIASRLTNRKYLAYSKVARNNTDGPLHFTEPQESWVIPSAGPGFLGNVVLLTGPDTVSAGETFAMALFGREPHVTRIGLSTQGVFSDVLNRRLPNGWRFDLPNEIYLTADQRAFDGTGVPPDVRIQFFSVKDLNDSHDAAIEEGQKLLLGRLSTGKNP
jgi:C-terminal processing protease CtpA/Prc